MQKVKTVLLLSLLTMFVPLSMDLYLPALPQMQVHFQTTELALNSTLYAFYFFMAIGMMFIGPLSDRFGRKPILIPSILLYCLASGLCALSQDAFQLMVCRCFQALGVGTMITVSTAITSDAFVGVQRDRMLGVTQAFSLIAPLIAPILGAFLLLSFPWQFEFIVLALFGAVALALALMQKETLPNEKRLQSSSLMVFKEMKTFVQDKQFLLFVVVTSFPITAYMAFVSASSYIYQGQFSLSEMQYGLVYGANAAISIIAALLSIRIRSILKTKQMLHLCFVFILLSGVAILVCGQINAGAFFFVYLPTAFCCIAMKPVVFSVLLAAREASAGAVSALANFAQTLSGCLGIVLVSLAWGNMILGLGIVVTFFGLCGLAGWRLSGQSFVSETMQSDGESVH